MEKVHSVNSDIPLISIVAPVYNVESFLQECIDSVLNQSFKDFELILVDDGSPDRCGEICDRSTEKDSRIRVFHQKNGGACAARKHGVEKARGEWVYMIDPDDRLPPNALHDLITACDKLDLDISGIDVVEGSHTSFKINEKTEKEEILLSDNTSATKIGGTFIVNGFEYTKNIVYHYYSRFQKNVMYHYSFTGAPWRKIIRRSLLLETDALNISRDFIQFDDVLVTLKMARKLRRAIRIQTVVYNYRINIQGMSISKKNIGFTCDYTTLLWKAVKEILQDKQELYKVFVVSLFFPRFYGIRAKTWHLRSTEFAPYLAILKEKKNLLSTSTKLCLLSTYFPFTLIHERIFFFFLFGAMAVFSLPKRIVRKLLQKTK